MTPERRALDLAIRRHVERAIADEWGRRTREIIIQAALDDEEFREALRDCIVAEELQDGD